MQLVQEQCRYYSNTVAALPLSSRFCQTSPVSTQSSARLLSSELSWVLQRIAVITDHLVFQYLHWRVDKFQHNSTHSDIQIAMLHSRGYRSPEVRFYTSFKDGSLKKVLSANMCNRTECCESLYVNASRAVVEFLETLQRAKIAAQTAIWYCSIETLVNEHISRPPNANYATQKTHVTGQSNQEVDDSITVFFLNWLVDFRDGLRNLKDTNRRFRNKQLSMQSFRTQHFRQTNMHCTADMKTVKKTEK
jgi:hypothetical protein